MALALKVFMEFEAPDYGPQGKEQTINSIRFTPMKYIIQTGTST
jgi:hypothetical protein